MTFRDPVDGVAGGLYKRANGRRGACPLPVRPSETQRVSMRGVDGLWILIGWALLSWAHPRPSPSWAHFSSSISRHTNQHSWLLSVIRSTSGRCLKSHCISIMHKGPPACLVFPRLSITILLGDGNMYCLSTDDCLLPRATRSFHYAYTEAEYKCCNAIHWLLNENTRSACHYSLGLTLVSDISFHFTIHRYPPTISSWYYKSRPNDKLECIYLCWMDERV